MKHEISSWVQNWRLNHYSDEQILEKIKDIQLEMEPFEENPESEGFIIFNDSTANQKYSLLVEIAEKRKLQI